MHGNIVIVIVLLVLVGMGIGLYFLMKHIITVIITRSETAKELENGGFMPGDEMDFAAAGPPPGAKSNMGTEVEGDASTWERNFDGSHGGDGEPSISRTPPGPPEFEDEYVGELQAESTAMGFTEEQHNDALITAKQAANQAWCHVQAVLDEQQCNINGQAVGEGVIVMLDEFRLRIFAETGRQHYWMHLVNMLVGPMTEAYHGALQRAMDSNMQTRTLWESYHASVMRHKQQSRQQSHQQSQHQSSSSSQQQSSPAPANASGNHEESRGRRSMTGTGHATRSSIRPIQPSGTMS